MALPQAGDDECSVEVDMADANPAQGQDDEMTISGQDDQAPVSNALSIAARMMRTRTAALLSAEGLFAGQDALLLTLGGEKSLKVGEIAKRLGVRAPTVSKTLTRLTEARLVSRSSVSGDKRRVAARITAKGRAKLDRIVEIRSQVEKELLLAFDPEEQLSLHKLLRKAAWRIVA
jgi:DNA-binding MarR family transcriptional regulator